MKIAIMQPYFFPYVGYFSLIKHTNLFILLDEVQFIRHGWIERNRILNPNKDFTYIKVPLDKKQGRDTLIREVEIKHDEPWKQKIISQIEIYKKIAPHYREVRSLVEECLAFETNSITVLNKHILQTVSRFLSIDTPIKIFSEMDLKIETPEQAGDWALNICKLFPECVEYWNPPGGMAIFDAEKYRKHHIEIRFITNLNNVYLQSQFQFQSNLSIIDVLMFNTKEDTHKMIDNYSFIN